MLQQESHKGRLETSGKMPTRHPADKVHYIVQGLATYPFSDFGTGRSKNGYYRINSIIDACWHSILPSPFRAYPKENPALLGREYLNWLFAVQEFNDSLVLTDVSTPRITRFLKTSSPEINELRKFHL